MISPNFEFLATEFPNEAGGASLAESAVESDPRGALFHCRHTLERTVLRIYKMDGSLVRPKVQTLDNLLNEATFKMLLPQAVWMKADLIRKEGNNAVHGKKAPKPETAQQMVEELHHILYWVGRTYLRHGAEELAGLTYDREAALRRSAKPSTREELQRSDENLQEEKKATLDREQDLQDEIEKLRSTIAEIKAANAGVEEEHDYHEAETRRRLIDVDLRRAGWSLTGPDDLEYPVTGMPSQSGKGAVDYVLWNEDGKPLAVVEAKRTTANPQRGQQQAKLYADCLEKMHGQRPVIFYTNGYRTWMWDDTAYPPREVAGFYKRDELHRLILRRFVPPATRYREDQYADRGTLLPEARDREHQRRLHRLSAKSALGHGDRDRKDENRHRPGRSPAARKLDQTSPLPGRSRFLGHPGSERLQAAPTRFQSGESSYGKRNGGARLRQHVSHDDESHR